ncbi:7,8-didemethyl-8-hydroxy-5-deazariboflavin synthase subunit CofG [bacterium]|nr:MAG: 7,8-didemethyl-8-hydroxy-5-deazariboflavin synthase subunit CofG [bacterium]
MEKPVLTYSHSLLLPLTRSCGVHCNYCTFKRNDGTLLTFDEIETELQKHSVSGICEVTVTAGQALEELPEISEQLNKQGYASYTEYVRDVCHLILENGLLPSLDIGPMTYAQLETLAPYMASMNLFLENINTDFVATIQKDKSIDERMECISDAGLLQIPVTTGILLGAGESIDDGFATLGAIEELHEKHKHIQSVVFQCVFSDGHFQTSDVSAGELQLLIKYCKKMMPNVAVSVPIQSSCPWLDENVNGVDDIGHVYEGTDGIDWGSAFPKLTEIERMIIKKGYGLKARFPIFETMFKRMRLSEHLQATINEWINKKEYMSYRN